MSDILEGRLAFHFPNDWEVVKFDDQKSFAKRQMDFDEVKKVDILALPPNGPLLILEVKDFRGYAIENKRRMKLDSKDSLHLEVAKKVRDTMATLVAAHRCRDESLKPFYVYLLGRWDRGVDVILFLEEDERRAQTLTGYKDRGHLKGGLEKQLEPYRFRCQVLRRRTMSHLAPWSVSSRPVSA